MSLADGTRPAPSKRRGWILVVEDDRGVRLLITEILRRENYAVVAVGSAEEALEQCRADAPDLLVTDIQLPGMDGIDLVRACHRSHPGTKVLCISGFVAGRQAELETVCPGDAFLPKPFVPAVLVERVRKLLAAK